jgi:hypothetical protein
MPVDTPIDELVRQLKRIGLRPSETLVKRILASGSEARDALLALASDHSLLHEESPLCWAPVHALRILGELQDPTTIPEVLGLFPLELRHQEEQPPQVWAQDAAQTIGHMGAPALEPLWAWFDDLEHTMASRSAAADAISYVTAVAPEERAGIIANLTERLEKSEDKAQTAFLITALSRLAASESYNQVMAAFRNGKVDTNLILASDARQLILGKGTPNLKCATHTLWERYDQHGPFAQAPQQ